MPTDVTEDPFEVEEVCERRGALLVWPDGYRRRVPVDIFRIEIRRATKAMAEHDARKSADVVPFRKEFPD